MLGKNSRAVVLPCTRCRRPFLLASSGTFGGVAYCLTCLIVVATKYRSERAARLAAFDFARENQLPLLHTLHWTDLELPARSRPIAELSDGEKS